MSKYQKIYHEKGKMVHGRFRDKKALLQGGERRPLLTGKSYLRDMSQGCEGTLL